jgi:Carbohydrate esterase, sialic acid-specific acetylesterase
MHPARHPRLGLALLVGPLLMAVSCEATDVTGRPDYVDRLRPAVPPLTESGMVVIGGRPVPREKVVVFLHIGHSNMAGRTDTPAELRPLNFETHPGLWAFTNLGEWLPAREPLSGDFLTLGRAGPGMSILRTALTLAPDAQIVSIGHGHDGSRGGRCSGFRRGGLLYEIVMGPARELKGKVTFGGILSMLVLMEAFVDKSRLATSHECYEGLAAEMRADLEDPDIPFLMSDWEAGATGQFSPTTPDAMVARAQLRVAQQNIPRSAIIPTDQLPMSDNHHFDLVGYQLWAERAFAILEASGWASWATTTGLP